MIRYCPERVLVQADSWKDGITTEILSRLQGVPVATITSTAEAAHKGAECMQNRGAAKRTLVLARFSGRFLKLCPGYGAEICCNYHVLNIASNCHFDCTYCVLQQYLDNPFLMVFTNFDDLAREVSETLGAHAGRFYRIGTGELADSLALDDITGFSRLLVPFFARHRNAVLELKTKSDLIGNLAGLDHAGRTIVSWSVNTPALCAGEELKTASLERRLRAARQCQEWGYRIGFHFDPIIWHENWETEYRDAVQQIFSAVEPDGIAWVSLGALRFTPNLKEIIRGRFPKSKIPFGEFVPGHHGKLRYFRPIREEMYGRMASWIREMAPRVFLYFCMEDKAAWQRCLGCAPRDSDALSDEMDAIGKRTTS
jgi:spore photoproduct lyase